MNKKLLIYIGVPILIILIIAGLLTGPVYSGYFSDKTMRGLKIGNLDVGGKTKEEITEIVTDIAKQNQNTEVIWHENVININLNESGINLDIEKTVEGVMKSGKTSFIDAVFSWYMGNVAEFEFDDSEEQFKTNISAILTELGIYKGNYSVTVDGKKAVFTVNEDSKEPDTNALIGEIKKSYPDLSEPFKLSESEFLWPTAEQIRDDFDSEAVDAYVDNSSGERKIVGHKEGRRIDFELLKEKISAKEKTFEVPYEILKPKVYTDQLGDENFPVLLGKCVTYYNEGAVGRSYNVKLAASKINGYVMNKGDVFSFNTVVGKRTHAAGFKDAPVYTADGVEDGVGGGICQVSSTLYSAVLMADLDIVSRRNHSYTVSYTVPGFDATVSYGSIDFKFSNPFPQPIKIKAVASGGAMTVYVYGTKQNDNTVSLEHRILSTTPRQIRRRFNPELPSGTEKVVSTGYDGMKVQNFKHIKDASGNIIKTENLGVSTYVTLDKVIEYNDGSQPQIQEEQPLVSEEVVLPVAPSETPVVNPTQPDLQQDTEYSGNSDPNAPLVETETENEVLNELENIIEDEDEEEERGNDGELDI